jgi:hypothetical protein
VIPTNRSELRKCDNNSLETSRETRVKKLLMSLFALLIVCPAAAVDKGDPRERVLDASHSTRINDVDMKPWHLTVNFRLK